MRLEQIGAYSYGVQVSRVQRKEQDSEADSRRNGSRFSRKDTYEPAGDSVHKADSLSEVKKRVSSHFYQSDVVTDDLAEVFTKLFDR